MPDNPVNLGPWEADREQLVLAPMNGAGLYSARDVNLAFRTAVLRFASEELVGSNDNGSDPAYFVLADKDLFEKVRPVCARVFIRQRPEARSRQLRGAIWFVPSALSHGFVMDTDGKTPEEVFDIIEKIGGGNRFTVVVGCDQKEWCIYPNGLSDPETSEIVDLSSTICVNDIETALDGLYRLIRSPDQEKALPLWENPGKWMPVRKAEDAVQHNVVVALASRFAPRVDVRQEQPATIGRTDVELVQTWKLPPGHVIRHALIELKVIRSVGSTGKPVPDRHIQRHISQGLRQATHYGDEHNSRIRMLCCYDMRKEDIGDEHCFKDFFAPARDRNVHLKRYFLHNSSKALREALDAAAIAVGASPLPA